MLLPSILIHSIKNYLTLIKFSHTLFALPFALLGAWTASAGELSFAKLFWIVLAMAGGRSGAMGFNRLIDRQFDAQNPRSQIRPSVTGEISVNAMKLLIVLSYAVLVFAAYQLNVLAFALSPIAILATLFYSYTKRLTTWSHLWLGLAIGIAPSAAWIAMVGRLDLAPVWLSLSVMFWIAGFDVIYALQDREVDTRLGLHSIPVRFGEAFAMKIAQTLHFLAWLAWCAFGLQLNLSWGYWTGVMICGGLLIFEHCLADAKDAVKINLAFFQVNIAISLILLVATILDFILFQ